MKTNPSNEERIAKLEKEVQVSKNEALKYAQELKKLRQQYADDLYSERQQNKELRQERQHLEQDYAQLRVQKGGFGLKILVLTGFVGTLVGLLLCLSYFMLLKPKDDHTLAFERFRDKHLFDYERAISQGQFEVVEKDLEENLVLTENSLIRPEIEFTKKIIGAAKRKCQ